jgi:hypothetical protein
VQIVHTITLSIAEMNERWAKLPRLEYEDAVLFEEVLRDIRQNTRLSEPLWD